MNAPSLYQRLNISQQEIRLLEIISVENGKVSCSLSLVSLQTKPHYAALSYVWGDALKTEDILVNGEVFAATTNLANALRYVQGTWSDLFPDRDPSKFRIWVDAISINQQDIEERNAQVQLMASIYRGADVVLAWLGQGEPEMILGLETLELIATETEGSHFEDESLHGLDWMMNHERLCVRDIEDEASDTRIPNKSWEATFNIFAQPYWTRVWIFQEMALAKRLVFFTVNRHLDYAKLEQAWEALRAAQRAVMMPSFRAPAFIHKDVLSVIGGDFWNWSIAQRIHAGRVRVRSFFEIDDAVVHQLSGWMVAFFGTHFKSTDPKDHIYGLLALSGIDLVPDYDPSTPPSRVYSDYVASFLNFWRKYRIEIEINSGYLEKHELFILHYCGIGLYENTLNLPSWAPNFPEESEKGLAGKFVDADADAKVFGPETEIASVSQGRLTVTGVQVDRIVHVSQAPSEETWWDGSMLAYFKDFVSRNTLYRALGFEPLHVILKTVQLNHGNAATDEDRLFFALHFLEFILSPEMVNTGSINLSTIGLDWSSFSELFLRTFCPAYSGPEHDWKEGFFTSSAPEQVEFRAELSGAVISAFVVLRKRWRFFESERGYFGLCPIKSIEGDQVCILRGSGIPVVLRKVDGDCYQHVGTCLVLGLMEGEAVSLVQTGECKITTMDLQ
ncbi:heterokaryon incompatibility protein-domain-containing protein [Rhexocercosporidium sp. MPI-PUGE-AT-0058]|nr:heterokaryon incompatibility protein-domain-containing protein [Rhexocercosporidium sp. MPI-PUGE-AT-0058]